MGRITITFAGSFGGDSRSFSAMSHGHAHAVAEAIDYLAGEKLPQAIAQDHALHSDGDAPSDGWKK